MEVEVRRPRCVGCAAAEAARGRELTAEEAVGQVDAGCSGLEGSAGKELIGLAARREAVLRLMAERGFSQRCACELTRIDPKTVYREPDPGDDDLRERLRSLAPEWRRLRYPRLGILLEREGIQMNRKKLYRLYSEEGLAMRRRIDYNLVRPSPADGGLTPDAGRQEPAAIPYRRRQRHAIKPKGSHNDQGEQGVGKASRDLACRCLTEWVAENRRPRANPSARVYNRPALIRPLVPTRVGRWNGCAWLVDEIIPCGAAVGDDVVVAFEDAVREAVVAQELPDVFDGIELWRAGWKRQELDVPGHDERSGEMPSGLVEEQNGVGAPRYHGANLDEMRLHRLRVTERHYQSGALALGGADRSKEMGPGSALVVRRARPGPAPRPSSGEIVLRADPCLVLPPELYALAPMCVPDLAQALRETFLKASAASGSCA